MQTEKASSPLLLRVVVGIWAAGVIAGLAGLGLYSAIPADAGTAPLTWPLAAHESQKPSKRTLVMFLHPHCPCSHASLSELTEITDRTHGMLEVHVYVVLPPGVSPDWASGEMALLAAKNPRARIIVDLDGVTTGRFQAAASGETFVYGHDGRLEFHGGITGARGHTGENAGRNAIVQLVHTGIAPVAGTEVFGCSLLDEICGPASAAGS